MTPKFSSESPSILNTKLEETVSERTDDILLKPGAYGAAPNALVRVSFRIAEKVLVITATKRLISQKFRTMTQIMEKKEEKKDSESIAKYIGAVN